MKVAAVYFSKSQTKRTELNNYHEHVGHVMHLKGICIISVSDLIPVTVLEK